MISPDELSALATMLDLAAVLLDHSKYEPHLRPDYPAVPRTHSLATALAAIAGGTAPRTGYPAALERLTAMLWLTGQRIPTENGCEVQTWGMVASKADAVALLRSTASVLVQRAGAALAAAGR